MSDEPDDAADQRRWYPTPQATIERARREPVAYVAASHVGTGVDEPDFLAVVDTDPDSDTYQRIVHEVRMPTSGDGLHRLDWNAWSSTPPDDGPDPRSLVVPGRHSSQVHVVEAGSPRRPELVSSVRPDESARYDLSAPHTARSVPGGGVVVSMLADADGGQPAGFLELDEEGYVAGRYDEPGTIATNGDFWYQPRADVTVSTAWPTPAVTRTGLDPGGTGEEYGQELAVWDWSDRMLVQTLDLGEPGRLPAAVRFRHGPDTTDAYVPAAYASNVFHVYEDDGLWYADPVIEFEPRTHPDHGPVPAFPVDAVVSMDDRYLFVANWLHGEVVVFDVSDPSSPRRVDNLAVGGLFGEVQSVRDRSIGGGPATLQLSLDGTRLYWTTSCEAAWDEQFFPTETDRGSVLLLADVDPRRGQLSLDETFLVDFGTSDAGPARAGGIRWPDADPTSDAWP